MTTIVSDLGLTCASGNTADIKVSMPATGSYVAGDIVFESTTGVKVSGWKRLTTGSGHVLNTDWGYFNMPAAPQSMVRLNTANGYGSTNTCIRRFTTTVVNQGTDITYADSATLGASFTINTNGVYSISYSDTFNASNNTGISLNTASPTTSILTITAPERLAIANANASNAPVNVTWGGYLAAGSIIRAHGAAIPTGATDCVVFTIARGA